MDNGGKDMEENMFCEICGYNSEESDEKREYAICVECDSFFCEECGDINKMICYKCIREEIEMFGY
jgi:hypothetical protein